MKKALSCKFILLFIAFALSIALAFSFYGAKSAQAADITSPSSGFSGGQSIVFEHDEEADTDYVAATVKSGDKVSIKNPLVVDDLAIEMNVPETVPSFKIILTYDSYFVNGAYNDGSFDKEITNEFTFPKTGDFTVSLTTDNNVLSVKVGDVEQAKDGNYYKIKGADKCAAKIAFEFNLAENTESAEIIFKSIDQKASDESGAYKQTFKLEDNKIATIAKPRVDINNLPIVKDGDKLNAVLGQKYPLSFTAYSLFNTVKSDDVYISESDNIWADPSATKPKSIIFKTAGETEFSLRTADIENIESYNVVSVSRDSDENETPKYINYDANAEVYEWYTKLVEKAAIKEYTIDENKKTTRSIRLGDTYEIPSLEDLVYDDFDLYSSLTYTVYYKTPSNSNNTSSLSFTVSEAGDYEFYVVFKDANGKAMEKDDFYTEDDDGIPSYDGCKYKNAVFTFTVEDNAPISVEVPETQGKGYLDTTYVATGFKILSGDNETFTLYYNADKNATADSEGWVEIPNLSDINEDYNDGVFTYSDIKTLAYDGKYTFTPVKMGAYKIKCFVSSGNAVRYAEGETVISVADKPAEVKVPSTWLKDNVWSVVFLSIGTVALIGIIVLLFIKPKEETETDETGDALNVNAKK